MIPVTGSSEDGTGKAFGLTSSLQDTPQRPRAEEIGETLVGEFGRSRSPETGRV